MVGPLCKPPLPRGHPFHIATKRRQGELSLFDDPSRTAIMTRGTGVLVEVMKRQPAVVERGCGLVVSLQTMRGSQEVFRGDVAHWSHLKQ